MLTWFYEPRTDFANFTQAASAIMKAADVDSFRGFLTARAPFEILLTNSN
jgi:hypothetical protein